MKRIIPILGLVCTVFFSCTMNEMVFDDLNDSGQEKLITRTSVTMMMKISHQSSIIHIH